LARHFIERYVVVSDLTAILGLGAVKPATQNFTSNRELLLAAVDRFSSTKLLSSTVERDQESQRGSTASALLHNGRDPSDGERLDRLRSLTSTLEAVCKDLARMPASDRKTVALFSEGIDYNVMDLMGVVQRYSSDVVMYSRKAVESLLQNNVTLYAIDPRRLGGVEGDRVEIPVRSQLLPTNDLVNQGLEGEYQTSIRSLRSLAEPTGGFAAVDRNDSERVLRQISEETTDYYRLVYVPSASMKPGVFNPIAVTVTRPSVTVTAREGYIGPKKNR